MRGWRALFFVLCAALTSPAARAEDIKLGMIKSIAGGGVYLAQDRGYFAAEGLTVQLVVFDSAQPIAVAAASGDIDVGVTGLTGGFFGLASQGVLRLIAGYAREVPSFNFNAYVVSNRAYEAGLRSYKDFPGHSFAISQFGSPPHYALALLAEKYGFDLKSMRLVPLQSISNIAAALVGGQVDTASLLGAPAIPIIGRGEVKLLGWTGDETPWQLGVMFITGKTADTRPAMVQHVLRAFRKGVREYHDAFTGPGEKRADQPTAPAALEVLAKYTGLSVAQVRLGIVYVDPGARLDERDVRHQFDWYRSQGMVKAAGDGDAMFDRRYLETLPGR